MILGKSSFVSKILHNKENLFKPNAPQNVILFYKAWQALYKDWKEKNLVQVFIQNTPQEDYLKELLEYFQTRGGSMIIFDDLLNDVNETILNCFTVYSHHYNATVLLLSQSLFFDNKIYRSCSLNAQYIVLMKSRRDALSASFLARQISPYHTKFVTEAYMNATKNPYSYLLFDLRQETSDTVRLRSNIFSNIVSIYIECDAKKNKK